jgi:alanine-synthesizing transaminase
MNPTPSSRFQDYQALKSRALESSNKIVDISMINPDIPPPRALLDRLLEASFKVSNHRYAVSRGIGKAREAFALKYQRSFQVTLDPESEVCVTLGTKDACNTFAAVLAHRGIREVIVPIPVYPPMVYALAHVGIRAVEWHLPFDLTTVGDRELSQLEALLEAHSPCAVMVNFPSNPSGTAPCDEVLARVMSICKRSNAPLLNDFTYGELGHRDFKPTSMLSLSSDKSGVVETYTMSKAYGVPGWRVGALCGDAEILSEVYQIKARCDYGLFLPFQIASASILSSNEDFVAPLREEYTFRATALRTVLEDGVCGTVAPQAGSSIWCDVSDIFPLAENPGVACAIALLELGFAVAPGVRFSLNGEDKTRNGIRIALVASSGILHPLGDALTHLKKINP